MQVVEGVGRDRELGEDDEVDARLVRPHGLGEDRVAIEGDVGGQHPRRRGRHPHEAVAMQREEVAVRRRHPQPLRDRGQDHRHRHLHAFEPDPCPPDRPIVRFTVLRRASSAGEANWTSLVLRPRRPRSRRPPLSRPPPFPRRIRLPRAAGRDQLGDRRDELGGREGLGQHRGAAMAGRQRLAPVSGGEDEGHAAGDERIGDGVDPAAGEIGVEHRRVDRLGGDEGERPRHRGDRTDDGAAGRLQARLGVEREERLVLDHEDAPARQVAGGARPVRLSRRRPRVRAGRAAALAPPRRAAGRARRRGRPVRRSAAPTRRRSPASG